MKKYSAKEQKSYLLAEIDAAIELAPKRNGDFQPMGGGYWDKFGDPAGLKEGESVINARRRVFAANREAYGVVKIHVQGGGDFELLNDKGALRAFKALAKSFPTSPNIGRVRLFTLPSESPSDKRMRDFAGWYYGEFQPHKQAVVERGDSQTVTPRQYYNGGFFSDGHYLVKVARKPKTKYPIETAVNPEDGVWAAPDLKKFVDEKAGRDGFTLAQIVDEFYFGDDNKRTENGVYVIVRSAQGVIWVLPAKHVDSVLTENPNAVPYSNGECDPIIFRVGFEVVGLVMSMKLPLAGIPDELMERLAANNGGQE